MNYPALEEFTTVMAIIRRDGALTIRKYSGMIGYHTEVDQYCSGPSRTLKDHAKSVLINGRISELQSPPRGNASYIISFPEPVMQCQDQASRTLLWSTILP
jgi:hypothetical protein